MHVGLIVQSTANQNSIALVRETRCPNSEVRLHISGNVGRRMWRHHNVILPESIVGIEGNQIRVTKGEQRGELSNRGWKRRPGLDSHRIQIADNSGGQSD